MMRNDRNILRDFFGIMC
uniref:Uncharacterized protein n=1 Tax=Anguilla anguilla TaxID=7936 RepID=A0A0E9VR61_ANGAN